MKKVLIISEFSGGGVERVNRLLADELKKKYDVYFLAIKGNGKDTVRGEKFISLDKKSGKSGFIKLIKKMIEIQPNLILTCSHTDTFCANIYKYLFDKRCKSMFVVHSVYSSMFKYKKKRQLLFQHYVPKLMHLYNLCDAVIFVSEGVKKDFLKFYKVDSEKMHVIYNPVLEGGKIEKKDPLSWHNPIRLVTVGRLEVEKRQDVLIETVYKLKQRNIISELCIYGAGSLLETLKKQAESLGVRECIHFSGYVPDIRHKLCNHDIFLLSSEFESFGNVIVEAMSVGLPVIAYDCPVGPREILDMDGSDLGYLLSENSSESFSEKIIDLLYSEKSTKKIENAKKASEKYAASVVVEKYAEVFKLIGV